MYIHLQKNKILKEVLWDKKYLQPINDILYDILYKYKNNEDYIQEILNLREVVEECDYKFVKYYIADSTDKHYIRLIDDCVTNDMRFLLFTLYDNVLHNNPLVDVPNLITLEYCIFKEHYVKNNIIDKDYGLDINEKDHIYNVLIPNPTEDDISKYVLDKHYRHIQYQVMNYMGDDTMSQVVINSIYDYQKELIEMCRTNISVEDTKLYTHPSSEFMLYLIPSVAKQILPMFSELLGLELSDSSSPYPSYPL
jgi:hypothetical protein